MPKKETQAYVRLAIGL